MEISIISMVFTAILVLSCLFLILSPFFKWDSYLQVQGNKQEMTTGKEGLLTTLNEIEFEYKMDKLSETDYKKLKRQYEVEVSKLIKLEEQQYGKVADDSILAEVEREIEEVLKQNKKRKRGEEID